MEKTDNELLENQDLIDDFMKRGHWRTNRNHEWISYHNSWNMLMPVVEKINNMQPQAFRYSLEDGPLSPLAKLYIHSPLTEVYKSIVEFLKWYNTQTK